MYRPFASKVRIINWSLLRSFLLLITIAFLIAWAAIGHAATPDAEALLKRSDTYRNGWPAYVLRVKITNFESGKSDEESLFEVSQKGTDKTYVEFMSPRDKGRHLLMLGDDMWIYLPDTSRPVRITPLERLSGDASNGDVARTNYAVDYFSRVRPRRKNRQRKLPGPQSHRQAQRRNLPAHSLLGPR